MLLNAPRLLLLIALICSTAHGSESAADSHDAFHWNALIGRGVNLGNALEAPEEGQWGVVL